ncbi:hypothetical protein FHX37_3783 [Haloactinospora alba]|uniref:Serine/arginine repetitive matrix protein 2 n=1 Tax=Haloactinospora alba TaxID=405555 RepID=A0A543N9E1_9ACTN|nr:hypothetical protein [Haloactinospora alba]TQN28438.1 hypothetical protein FHX37_3783 [Haloactinospora alba]
MSTPPSSVPSEIRPRKLWFWIGGALIVLGVGGGITGFVLGMVNLAGATSTEAEFTPPETATFRAEQVNTDSDMWKLYADRDVPSSEVARSCELTGPDGRVDIDDPGYNSESTVNGDTWILVARLDVTQPGEYTMECAAETGADLSVGYGPDGSSTALTVVGSIGALLLAPLGLLLGLVTLIVTGVRRSNHRGRLRETHTPPPGSGPYKHKQ